MADAAQNSGMKLQRSRAGFSIAVLAALLVCSCFTREAVRTHVRDTPDQFKSLLDSMVNDRRTWVDPPEPF